MSSIEMAGGGRRWRITLVDGPTSRDFLKLLPLRLTLRKYAGREKIADLPRRIDDKDAPNAMTPRRGDVAFYAPWGNLAIFHQDGHRSPGLIPIGRIDGDLDALASREVLDVLIARAGS